MIRGQAAASKCMNKSNLVKIGSLLIKIELNLFQEKSILLMIYSADSQRKAVILMVDSKLKGKYKSESNMTLCH